MQQALDARRQQLRDELSARLERFRGRMTDAEFGELVIAMEGTAQRFTEIGTGRTASAPALPLTFDAHSLTRLPRPQA